MVTDPTVHIEGVLSWLREVIPALKGGYAFIPTKTDQELPDVVVDMAGSQLTPADPRFAFLDVQQGWVMVHTLDVSFMVDDQDPEAAAQQLRGFQSAIMASLLRDGTLGGRVPFVSPHVAFDYTLPFVERPDGTLGREMAVTLLVGELLEEQT